MKFKHYNLGYLHGGEIVEVILSGNAANVRLIDNSNFQSYKACRNHKYYGGHATKSPIRLSVPHSVSWNVVIYLGGYGGSIRSSVRVLPGSLPKIKEPSLSTVPSLVHDIDIISNPGDNQPQKKYDVFISYATEDKLDLVHPLAIALKNEGLIVWYDDFELKIGDSLRRSIDKGLANSRFGIVVLSRHFIRKGWTNYELDGIITRVTTGEQIVLPIWHNITKQEVIDYSPSLADKLARNTSNYTVEEIATEIAEVIQKK